MEGEGKEKFSGKGFDPFDDYGRIEGLIFHGSFILNHPNRPDGHREEKRGFVGVGRHASWSC